VTAEVTTADGTAVLTYAIGTDGYYMMVSGDDSVYTVDGQTVAALCQTAEQLNRLSRAAALSAQAPARRLSFWVGRFFVCSERWMDAGQSFGKHQQSD